MRPYMMVAALAVLAGNNAVAQMINLGTQSNASSWLVTGAGASMAPAYPYGGQQQEISLTSNGGQFGTFVTGASLANFNGFWYADRKFTLPAGATGVALTFTGLQADARAVLELNGTIIGNIDMYNGPGPSQFAFPPGPPDQPYTFTNQTSGVVTSGFLVGGENTLRLIVNNTNGNTTSTFTGVGDGTHAGVVAAVAFTPVPEPGSIATAAACCALAGFRNRRRLWLRKLWPIRAWLGIPAVVKAARPRYR